MLYPGPSLSAVSDLINCEEGVNLLLSPTTSFDKFIDIRSVSLLHTLPPLPALTERLFIVENQIHISIVLATATKRGSIQSKQTSSTIRTVQSLGFILDFFGRQKENVMAFVGFLSSGS